MSYAIIQPNETVFSGTGACASAVPGVCGWLHGRLCLLDGCFLIASDGVPPTNPLDWSTGRVLRNISVGPTPVQVQQPQVFRLGITKVEFNVTDLAGNSQRCFFDVRSTPAVYCPPSVEVTTSQYPNGIVSLPAAISPPPSLGATTVVTTPVNGSVFPLGVTRVTVNVTDAYGASGDCSYNVSLVDDTPPQFTSCVSPPTAVTSDPNGTTVTWPAPEATDNSGVAPTITLSQSSGSFFPLGQTVVIATASDGALQTVCEIVVTVAGERTPLRGRG